MMLRTLYNCIRKVEIRKYQPIYLLQGYCTVSTKNVSGDNFDLDCFLDHENKILMVLNNSNVNQLRRYIKSSYAKIIISHRKANGPYKSINDLLSVNELQCDVVNKLCISVIDGISETKLFPTTPEIQGGIPKTILGLHVSSAVVSWTLIHNREVLNWDYETWYNENVPNDICTLIKSIPRIIEKIPSCEVYVMEDTCFIKRRTKNVVFLLQIQHYIALNIATCLAVRNRTSNLSSDPVYVLRPLTTAQFFDLRVGSEVISSNYAFKIEENNLVMKKGNLELQLSSEVKNKYMQENVDNKEQMNWSLLKAAAFLQRAIYLNQFNR